MIDRTPQNGVDRFARVAIVGMLVISVVLIIHAGQSIAATEGVIFNFTYSEGGFPTAGLVSQNGKLYGTTYLGGVREGGTVFEMTPPSTAGGLWTLRFLHAFAGGIDGFGPAAGLLSAKNGTLYSTTKFGGASGAGTVFKMKPPATLFGPWTESVLYAFIGGIDGSEPLAGLIAGQNGVLFGTTEFGGTSNLGVVFALTPPVTPNTPWTESVLYSFTGGGDGAMPVAGLVADQNGTLYGTTSAGGVSGLGTAFALVPPASPGDPWTESVLYSFAGAPDGNDPVAGLLVDRNGTLYGTTEHGGLISSSNPTGNGTVFALTPPATPGAAWTETIIYSFGAFSGDAENPLAGLLSTAGTLVGTTYNGGVQRAGGTVYQLTPPATAGGAWTDTVLHTFSGGAKDGIFPVGGVVVGPHAELYGTTEGGGNHGGAGTVFEVTP